jgi:hypothetical protein
VLLIDGAGVHVVLFSQPDACKLPPLVRLKKVPVSISTVSGWGYFRGATQYMLVHHEFAIVFA